MLKISVPARSFIKPLSAVSSGEGASSPVTTFIGGSSGEGWSATPSGFSISTPPMLPPVVVTASAAGEGCEVC